MGKVIVVFLRAVVRLNGIVGCDGCGARLVDGVDMTATFVSTRVIADVDGWAAWCMVTICAPRSPRSHQCAVAGRAGHAATAAAMVVGAVQCSSWRSITFCERRVYAMITMRCAMPHVLPRCHCSQPCVCSEHAGCG